MYLPLCDPPNNHLLRYPKKKGSMVQVWITLKKSKCVLSS